MISNILEQVQSGKPVVLDGATGTELDARCEDIVLGGNTHLAHIDHPEVVQRLALDYVEAGAQIILSNTLIANRSFLKQYGSGDKVVDLNSIAVRVLRDVGIKCIGGSVGITGQPYNQGMHYFGLGVGEYEAIFREQVQALRGVDIIVIETQMYLEEAQAALKVAKEYGLPTVISFDFHYKPRLGGQEKDYCRTEGGVGIDELASLNADIIGFNCGNFELSHAVEIIGYLRRVTDKPIWAKPNAGLPGQPETIVESEEFGAYGRKMIEAGANLVGGCCNSTPQHIKALSECLKE